MLKFKKVFKTIETAYRMMAKKGSQMLCIMWESELEEHCIREHKFVLI